MLTLCWRDLGDGEEDGEKLIGRWMKGDRVPLKWSQIVSTVMVYCYTILEHLTLEHCTYLGSLLAQPDPSCLRTAPAW